MDRCGLTRGTGWCQNYSPSFNTWEVIHEQTCPKITYFFPLVTSRTYSIRLTAHLRAQIDSVDPVLSFGCLTILLAIGCPRIIRTCSFSRFSPLRWNRWCCGFQNFQNYSSRVKAKRHTLPKSAYYSVQSLDQLSVGESFFRFCSKTKQATRHWQEAQPRLPQQTQWHDICWRA